MSNLDDELNRVLHDRADGMSHAPLAFDDVRGKAVSIRRRRRLASGIGVAAAIAVIVPTAMMATKSTNSDGSLPAVTQPTVATDTADPTPTSTPVMGKPHALDVRDLPTGAPPQVAYVDDAAQSNTRAYVVVGTDTVQQVGETVAITRDDGTAFGPFPASSLARTADGSAAAWANLKGVVMLWRPGADAPVAMGDSGLQGAIIQALTGDCREGGQCAAWVIGGDGSEGVSTSVRVDQDGSVDQADPGSTVDLVKDVMQSGLLIGVSQRDDYNSCSSLVALDTPGARWKTCKHTLDAFSPSGAYVAASDPFHSGNLNGNIAIYDAATGKATTYRIASAGDSAYYSYFAWEDDSHLLFAANQDGKWSIVRMGVDGSMEYAVPPAELGDELSNPFIFEGNATPM
jgi:WD40 repeat protein